MWDLLAIEAGPTRQCRLIRAKDVILLSTQDTQKASLPMSMHHLCLLTKLTVKITEKTDMTGLFAKLKELEAEILKLQNCGPHIQVCKPSLVPDANRRQRGSREKSTNLFHVRDTSLTLFDTEKVDHWT